MPYSWATLSDTAVKFGPVIAWFVNSALRSYPVCDRTEKVTADFISSLDRKLETCWQPQTQQPPLEVVHSAPSPQVIEAATHFGLLGVFCLGLLCCICVVTGFVLGRSTFGITTGAPTLAEPRATPEISQGEALSPTEDERGPRWSPPSGSRVRVVRG